MRMGFCGVLLLTLVLFGGLAHGVEVGEVAALKGDVVRHAADRQTVALKLGGKIFEEDRIVTGARALVSITFSDDTRFHLGPNSEFRVDKVRSEEGIFSAAVLRGAFRFVTGLIAKQRPRAMQVAAGSVATIGIRGTTVGGEVAGESATIVLLESEGGAEQPSAIEVGNQHGSVVIDQTGYGTRVPDAHSPPSPPARMSLRAIENLVRNINSIQRISIPRPTFR